MNLLLKRIWLTDYTTIGRLFIRDEFICYILEDPLRVYPNKIKGDTCIWGNRTYQVVIDYSPKFKMYLPHVLDVSLFTGIRFHAAGTVVATNRNTEGCLIPGLIRKKDSLLYSKPAFKLLLPRIQEGLAVGGKVTLTIINPKGDTNETP